MPQNAREWGVAVCNALGFDPSIVSSIEVKLDAAEPVTVIVRMYPDKSEAVVEALREAGKYVEHVKVIDNLRSPQFDTIADLSGGEPDALRMR